MLETSNFHLFFLPCQNQSINEECLCQKCLVLGEENVWYVIMGHQGRPTQHSNKLLPLHGREWRKKFVLLKLRSKFQCFRCEVNDRVSTIVLKSFWAFSAKVSVKIEVLCDGKSSTGVGGWEHQLDYLERLGSREFLIPPDSANDSHGRFTHGGRLMWPSH